MCIWTSCVTSTTVFCLSGFLLSILFCCASVLPYTTFRKGWPLFRLYIYPLGLAHMHFRTKYHSFVIEGEMGAEKESASGHTSIPFAPSFTLVHFPPLLRFGAPLVTEVKSRQAIKPSRSDASHLFYIEDFVFGEKGSFPVGDCWSETRAKSTDIECDKLQTTLSFYEARMSGVRNKFGVYQ